MNEFFQTRMGHQFYESTMPRIAKSLESIAARLEQQELEQNVINAAIAYRNNDGAGGTDCDLKNAVEELQKGV